MVSFSKRDYIYGNLTIKQIARKIKRELMQEFPSIKFSVRSKPLQNKIDVKILSVHRKYLKDEASFINDYCEANPYVTKDEYRRAVMQFKYTDFLVPLSVREEVYNKILQIYDKYNYYNNDEEHDILDQRYYGGVYYDIGCRVTGLEQDDINRIVNYSGELV